MHNTTYRGVFMDVLGVGVLLSGISGIGKSELGLSLIDRGHPLIADDCVFLHRESDHIIGTCPDLLQDFLEVRGLGIFNIRTMYGEAAIKKAHRLQLIVHIINATEDEIARIDRVHGTHRNVDILGLTIPEVSVHVAPGRNMSILVEGAVRNQLLKSTGYDASAEFAKKQQEQITRESL